jgi:4-hydroxybenzoate polyprenyltransferase
MNVNWRAYFELLRLPAVFTAIADVMMGYLVTHGDLHPFSYSGVLVAASAMMYLAGMVLNDYYDADVDAIERPQRPIPSGRIERRTAGKVGWTLLLAGIVVAGLTGFAARDLTPFYVAAFLATSIFLYDRFHKTWSAAPLLMGLCRTLNVLFGMSLYQAAGDTTTRIIWTYPQLAIAAGIGVYIIGVTVFARTESRTSARRQIAAGIAVMAAGVALLGFGANYVGNQSQYRWIVWLLIAVYVVLRHGLALVSPGPRTVQRWVRHALRMLIFLDFIVAFEAAPHSSGCLLILILLAPMLLLERWASTT